MIWILISIILGIIYEYHNGCLSGLFDYFMCGMMGLIIGLIPSIFLSSMIGFCLPKQIVIKEEKIISLSDNTSVEGIKYLFGGYIDEKYIYRYVIETDNGKQIKELDNNENVYIKYDNSNPRIVSEYSEFKSDWYCIFAINLSTPKKTIHVPEGTITEKYEINLTKE